MVDTGVLLVLYGCVWAVVSVALHLAGRRFMDVTSPAPHRLLVSILGGAVWPLVLIGVFEISSVVAYTKVQSRPSAGVGILV